MPLYVNDFADALTVMHDQIAYNVAVLVEAHAVSGKVTVEPTSAKTVVALALVPHPLNEQPFLVNPLVATVIFSATALDILPVL